MTDDRRDAERIEILGQLLGEVMVFQPMTMTQISTGGVQIETPFALQLDSLHDLRLTLGPRSIVVKGRIAYCHICDVDQERVLYRSGIEFVEPAERVRSAIRDFMDYIKAGRRGEGAMT